MTDDIEEMKLDAEVAEALDELVKEGLVEMKMGEDGEPRFRLTEKGVKKAEYLILKRLVNGDAP